jgi:hypothetical protein
MGSPEVTAVAPAPRVMSPLKVGSEKSLAGHPAGEDVTDADTLCTVIGAVRLFFTVKTMQRDVPGKRGAVEPEQAGEG